MLTHVVAVCFLRVHGSWAKSRTSRPAQILLFHVLPCTHGAHILAKGSKDTQILMYTYIVRYKPLQRLGIETFLGPGCIPCRHIDPQIPSSCQAISPLAPKQRALQFVSGSMSSAPQIHSYDNYQLNLEIPQTLWLATLDPLGPYHAARHKIPAFWRASTGSTGSLAKWSGARWKVGDDMGEIQKSGRIMPQGVLPGIHALHAVGLCHRVISMAPSSMYMTF